MLITALPMIRLRAASLAESTKISVRKRTRIELLMCFVTPDMHVIEKRRDRIFTHARRAAAGCCGTLWTWRTKAAMLISVLAANPSAEVIA